MPILPIISLALGLDRCRKAREEIQFVTFVLEAFERQERPK